MWNLVENHGTLTRSNLGVNIMGSTYAVMAVRHGEILEWKFLMTFATYEEATEYIEYHINCYNIFKVEKWYGI